VRRLDLALAGIFLGAWLLAAAFLFVPGLGSGAVVPAKGLFPWSAVVGWLAGNFYVGGTRRAATLRRLLLALYLGGPPGLVWLYWSLAPRFDRLANPLAPLWALGIFAVLFLVPVALRGFPRGR